MNTPPKRCREQNEITLPIKEKVETPRRGVSKKEMFCFSFRDVRDVTKQNLQLAKSNRFLLSLPKEEMIHMMTPFPQGGTHTEYLLTAILPQPDFTRYLQALDFVGLKS